MKLFEIFNLGGNCKMDKRTEEKIYETGAKFLAEHDAIMRGERNIFADHEMTDEETQFFQALSKSMEKAGFNPAFLKLHRLSSRTFNVDYAPLCYMGKINLSPLKDEDKFAVIRPGAKRALRVFNSEAEANDFHLSHVGTEIQFRPGQRRGRTYMQCLKGIGIYGDVEIIHMGDPSLRECIDAIPKWITYLRHCKRTSEW